MNFLAKPLNNYGYTYTFTTLVMKYLIEAEELFGKRLSNYEYMGIELNEDGPPQIWYPQGKYVVIQVSQSVMDSYPQAIFQISHEVIHLLSPNGRPNTNNLEEGLATYFSKIMTDRDSGDVNYAFGNIQKSKYFRPFEIVSALLAVDPEAVKKLRAIQPSIGEITKQNFIDLGIELDEGIIDELLEIMQY
jgi:hypothetical protein